MKYLLFGEKTISMIFPMKKHPSIPSSFVMSPKYNSTDDYTMS